ncbi:MAG: hypothetical protein QXP36_07945 [Conexivisphaerales archaeon]
MEVRIYFECLEQAYNYILPLVKKGVEKSKFLNNISIKLVRRPRVLTSKEKNALHTIYSLTTPDFLVTFCEDEREVPIIVGEISEAVKTEDHELQRAIGAIASALVGSIYLKISGEKLSPRDHGGKKEFNPLTTGKILYQQLNYSGFILGKWPTEENNPYILKRNKNFLSCPASIPIVEKVFPVIVKGVIDNSKDIIKKEKNVADVALLSISSIEEFIKYKNELDSAPGIDELRKDWEGRKKGTRKPRIYLNKDILMIKINRFSHAADPDRGILIFSSVIFNTKNVLVRYVVKKEVNSRWDLFIKFIEQAIEEGLSPTFFDLLKNSIKDKINEKTIEITEFLVKERGKWEGNKVLSSIFLFSDGFLIEGNGKELNLKWDREKIFKINKDDLKNSLIQFFKSKEYGKPLSIEETTELNEDEVTYIVVHQILKPNNFDIIFVSYPGAQGGFPILPEEKVGRKRPRKYIDIMAWLPSRNKNISGDIALEESKETFNTKEFNIILKRLNKFRTDRRFINALKSALKIQYKERELKHIFIGVAFGAVDSIRTRWNPTEVDFIIRIINREKWQLAFFGNYLKYAFKHMEGKIKLPIVYKNNGSHTN